MNTKLKKDELQDKKFSAIDIVITIIAFASFVGLIISCFLYFNWMNQFWLMILGWILFFLSPIPGIMARFAFKEKGDIAKGESCLNTKKIVNNGVFGIIRNPMYFTAMMFTVGLVFISLHWLSIVFAIPIIAYFYYYMRIEEELNIKKFGNEYLDYMKKVPRLNVILGLIRAWKT